LGKIIGVYLGRPFEGWTYERILEKLGEITYYVNDKIADLSKELWGHDYKPPLVVTDDDISGTFTFLRALPDYGNRLDLDPAAIGQTWLNYIIENRTVLWWGGMGNSTEHTAYLRLKQGYQAPQSGSIALNGAIVAEQIGAQIFIDGWAMVVPGDPEMAADLARRAASVSHDGEAIYGAQSLAAMESLAFVEPDINVLLDTAMAVIPRDSVIRRMIADLRSWHAAEPDWHQTFARIQRHYGYDQFGGNVHMVPNHALIILGLLYSNDDFKTAMKVVNTAGWDTDCNSGNLGCLMGIKNGLAGLMAGPDWRGPVADRILMPTADGGRAVTDAVQEALRIVNIGRSLAKEPPAWPKGGARFNFSFPGSVQGFSPEGDTKLENWMEHSQVGERSLRIRFREEGIATTPTFILPDELEMAGYQFMACPTLYAGQTIKAAVNANEAMVVHLILRAYDAQDKVFELASPAMPLNPGENTELRWTVPDMAGKPIVRVGIRAKAAAESTLTLDYLTWDGAPAVRLERLDSPDGHCSKAQTWRRAWVNGMDLWERWWKEAYRLVQNQGTGLLIQGTREWRNYEVEATVRVTLAKSAGIAARVQGMKRYYALLLAQGDKARLVKALDGSTTLAEGGFPWQADQPYNLRLQVDGARIRGWVDGKILFDVDDSQDPLLGGAAAFVLEEGHLSSQVMEVRPVKRI
jgi:ADP-ribosylglycohydrolase